MDRPSTSGTTCQVELVALVTGAKDRSRLCHAFAGRRVELLDEMVSPPSGKVTVVAVFGEDGFAEAFISCNQRSRVDPGLEDLRKALGELLSGGRFEQGTALVLGRRFGSESQVAGDYPSVLRFLQLDDELGKDRACICVRALMGARAPNSLMASILWWELGRAVSGSPTQLAHYAVERAGAGFRRLDARWQASVTAEACQRIQRRLQPDMFEPDPTLELLPFRFEVLPTLRIACPCETEAEWAVSDGRPAVSWRPLGRVEVDLDSEAAPDFGTTPLVIRFAEARHEHNGMLSVELAADYQARVDLGLDGPAREGRITYRLGGEGIRSGPRIQSACPGAKVKFLIDFMASDSSDLDLTCISHDGQTLSFDLAEFAARKVSDGEPGVSHASQACVA